MSLYAIGDLHLSLAADKPMEVFGNRWSNYVARIQEGFQTLTDEDVCVLCGDLSWSMNLEDAKEDFLFIERLPGKKLILKGNHDYWWSTASKAKKFFDELGITGIELLHNNCYTYGEYAICGTRGWFFDEESNNQSGEHNKKIMMREIGRLETSLKAAGDREKLVFLHYPPIYADYRCEEILALFEKYNVKICCYGHIHGDGCRVAKEGMYGNTLYKMVSADHVFFTPQKIL